MIKFSEFCVEKCYLFTCHFLTMLDIQCHSNRINLANMNGYNFDGADVGLLIVVFLSFLLRSGTCEQRYY